jgi:hypothetical protein
MKNFLTLAIFLLLYVQTSAQIVMKVYMKNGQTFQVPVTDIDSITYVSVTLPSLTTNAVSSIGSNSAVCGGNILDDGGSAVTDRGLALSLTPGQSRPDMIVLCGSGSGSFSSTMAGLSPGITYYVRAYAITLGGTAYGNEQSFTTGIPAPPAFSYTFDDTSSVLNIVSLGNNNTATSGRVDSLSDPVPGPHSGGGYWKCTGTSQHYYLEGLEIHKAFNFDLNDSIVFYANNVNYSNTRVFVQLIDEKNLNGRGEVFSYEIVLPASNSWQRYAVCINQIQAWIYDINYNDPGATHVYYPSLAGVQKLRLMINSVAFTDTLEVNFDNVEIIKVP